MSGNEIEAAGGALTAGLAAGALERGAGGDADDRACPNCNAEINGRFCAACGQPAHIHRTLAHFAEEALHGLFHFDTRAWRTAPMLAFRPGTLTRNYVVGKRAAYVSPIALFLLTIFVMFFVMALAGEYAPNPPPLTLAQMRADRDAARTALATGTAADPSAAQERLADLEERISTRESAIARLRAVRARLDAEQAAAGVDPEGQGSFTTARGLIDRALTDPSMPPESVTATISESGKVSVNVAILPAGPDAIFAEIRKANAEGRLGVATGSKALDKKIRSKLENPELAWYKLQNIAYKFSFLLAPLSLPFLWGMFFWKKGVTLFDHMVFVLYSLSFVSVLIIALVLIGSVSYGLATALATPAFAAIPVHMFFQLKGAYDLGWFSALWRTALLIASAMVALLLFLLTVLALGMI